MLDWDDIRVFLAVAREGSLSAAARRLQVTQPTVGRRMTAFEARLGTELFERTPRGQALTSAGRRLLDAAERMETDALSVERTVAGRDAGLRGRVVVTASEWLIQRLLAPLLAPLLERHAGLEVDLWADVRHLSLARREADIAIRPSRFDQHDVVERGLGELSFGLYAADAYLARYGAPDFAKQCEGHRLIAMSEALGKVPDLDFLPRVAARAQIAARSNGREAMATLAAAGLGIACLPCFVGDAVPGLRQLSAPEPAPRRQLWLGFHRDARALPRLRTVVGFLVEGFSRLRPALDPKASI